MGRAVRPGEPLWTEEDRAFALALLVHESEQCSGCGRPRGETTDPKMDGMYRAVAMRCHGCAAVARASKNNDHEPEGLYFTVTPAHAHRR